MSAQPATAPRLWVTRPAAQADATCQAMAAQGFRVLSVPVLAIVPVTGAAERQAIVNRILDFDRYDLAIFVSQNAVQAGAEWLADYWPQLPLHTRFMAIGEATGRALAEAGLPVVGKLDLTSPMNSEALLKLPELAHMRDRAVLIFRGRGGRTHLGDALAARGARVDYLELYERLRPDTATAAVSAALVEGPAVLSVHSGESLQNLATVLTELDAMATCCAWPLLVPGERVAKLAEALGFRHITVAANATDAAMAAAAAQVKSTVVPY